MEKIVFQTVLPIAFIVAVWLVLHFQRLYNKYKGMYELSKGNPISDGELTVHKRRNFEKAKFAENKHLTKDGVWCYNVSGVSLKMKIYWLDATDDLEEGFYMEPMEGQKNMKYNGEPCHRVFQLFSVTDHQKN